MTALSIQTGAAEGADCAIAFGPFTLLPDRRRLLAGHSAIRIGSRALDLLVHLVSRAGEVVSHRELTAQAWAGAQVEESNLRFQIGQLRKALAAHSADADYIANIPGRGYCFTGSLAPGSRPAGKRAFAPAVSSPLPLFPGSMIGRAAEISAVSECLAVHRLVTLAGSGGVGKTAVAVAAAHHILEDVPDTIPVFVDLASLDDRNLVASTVADALGTAVDMTNSLLPAPDLPADQEVLLVVDNCEHVIEEVALAIEGILAGTSRVRVLATSREPLHVAGEVVQRLHPLACPAPDETDILSFPAIQLFVARAELQVPGIALDEQATSSVARICRELDGLPLAIELVAARVGSLGLGGLVELLTAGYSGPAIGRRTSPSRHRTLQATFEWGYALLSAQEARMLRALSILSGRFSLEAALAVTGLSPARSHEGLALLATLAEKSCVVADAGSGSTRYRLLQTTRHQALRKLEDAGELAGASRRHAAFYAAEPDLALYVRQAAPDVDGSASVSRHASLPHPKASGPIAWPGVTGNSAGRVLTGSHAPSRAPFLEQR